LQGRGSNAALERGEAESLFREHVGELYDEVLAAFLDLLDAELKVKGSLAEQWEGGKLRGRPECRVAGQHSAG
jgi:hypothetical protein